MGLDLVMNHNWTEDKVDTGVCEIGIYKCKTFVRADSLQAQNLYLEARSNLERL